MPTAPPSPLPHPPRTASPLPSPDFEEIQAGLERAFTLVPQKPVVGATFHGLAAAPEAHTEVISRATGLPGRVVVLVEEEGAAPGGGAGVGSGEL